MWTSWPTATACCCLLPPFGVAVSDDGEPEDGLSGGACVPDLAGRRLADVAAWVDDEHGVGQVDLPEVFQLRDGRTAFFPDAWPLIAGKGHETYQDVKGVKSHFDDKEVLDEIFKGEE